MRASLVSLFVLLSACGAGSTASDQPVSSSPSPSQPSSAAEAQRPLDPNAPERLTIWLDESLQTSGGDLIVRRLSDLSQTRIAISPGQATAEIEVPPGETISAVQTSASSLVSGSVAQSGCTDGDDSTPPATLRVPDDFPTIQAAIDVARPGDLVQVAPGVYTEFVKLRPGVRLFGSGAGQTILDAQGQSHNLIDYTDAPGVVISGFTLRGVGQAQGCANPDDPFECSGNWYAAAIYGDGHEWTNATTTCNSASALVVHNVFEDNFIAVMPYFHAQLVAQNNVFVRNRYGVAVNHFQDHAAVLHNVFYENERIAVGESAGYVDVVDNVIARSAAGFFHEYIQRGLLTCNLFFENGTNEQLRFVESPRLVLGQDGNEEVDPLFVDAAAGDFHLAIGSPAIDASCTAAIEFDPDGSPADIGAYGGTAGGW